MRVMITGITGMIGYHLANLYLGKGYEVAGISRNTSIGRLNNSKYNWRHYSGDILDINFLNKVWDDYKPEIVFHLAGQAYNGLSWEAEDSTYHFNIIGSKNIFNVSMKKTPYSLLIPACSSAEYGIVPIEKIPIKEDITPLNPITPYGVSKACMEMMGKQYCLNYNMNFIFPRLFINIGPNHPPITAIQSFAMQLALIKLGMKDNVVEVGNLSTSRDFIDVRDGVDALFVLGNSGKIGEIYNICSGKYWSIKESLDLLIEISGLEINIKQNKELFRPSDENFLLGNNDKITKLGWYQKISFYQTLTDVFNNWMKRLK